MKKMSIVCYVLIWYAIHRASGMATTLETFNYKNTTPALIPDVAFDAQTTTRKPLLQGLKLPCTCLHGECNCCTGTFLDQFNQKACISITYEPDEFSFTMAVSLNGKIVYKTGVSGKNPAPICISLPRFRFVQLCVELSNIYFANRNMHVCIDMRANWENITLLQFSFDCIRMGINGVSVVRPEEGGGLPITPIDAEEQIDEDYDDNARKLLVFS